MQKADLVVGFNVIGFDYTVLRGYSKFDFKTLNTLDILREIHELTDQGCSVQLPAGEVPSVATTMLDRELCSENGAPITLVSCSASTEYNDACAPTNRLLREIICSG